MTLAELLPPSNYFGHYWA